MRIVGPAAFAFVLLTTGPAVQAQAPAGRANPALRLDLIVTTKDGRPVRDLRPEDLVVRLDSRPQTITRITHPPMAPATRGDLPAPYATNTEATGRATAVLVDVTRLLPSRSAPLQAGLGTLTAALSPADRIALIPLNTDNRPVDFTTTHRRVEDAAAALTMYTGAPRTSKQDETTVEETLGALSRASALLGGEPGLKTLVLVTEPFAITSRLRRTIQAFAEVVARHRIALHIVTPGSSNVPANNGVFALAAGTGGAVVTGDSWASVVTQERARVEVTLADDERLEADSVVRALVAPVRAGLIVRAVPFALVPAEEVDGLASLTDMLRQSRTYTDLPLRLAAYPILHSDRSSVRLLIVGETIETGRPLAWSEFALVTPDGRLVATWKEEGDALAQRPLVSGVLAPDGAYRLRWAASELSGRRGTVDVDVQSGLVEAGAFRLSALMVGQMADDTFVPVLQPSADDTTIEWYAEVYGDVAEGQVLTTRIDVLQARGGPVVTSTQGRVRGSPDRGRRALTGQLDVSLLQPGDHLLRATLIVDGVDAGSVTRTFRKVR